jgi:hypothetical protein
VRRRRPPPAVPIFAVARRWSPRYSPSPPAARHSSYKSLWHATRNLPSPLPENHRCLTPRVVVFTQPPTGARPPNSVTHHGAGTPGCSKLVAAAEGTREEGSISPSPASPGVTIFQWPPAGVRPPNTALGALGAAPNRRSGGGDEGGAAAGARWDLSRRLED